MTSLSTTAVLNSVVELLTEAYEGPPNPSSTWFIDNEPDSSILGLLANLSAEEASTSVDGSGETGSTIVSHTEHLRWSLEMMNAAMRGEPLGEWAESWRMVTANNDEWESLRRSMRAELDTLRRALKSQTELPEEYISGLLALLPHAAYHLGAIRQMIERVRE
jgi:hypothetical protein